MSTEVIQPFIIGQPSGKNPFKNLTKQTIKEQGGIQRGTNFTHTMFMRTMNTYQLSKVKSPVKMSNSQEFE